MNSFGNNFICIATATFSIIHFSACSGGMNSPIFSCMKSKNAEERRQCRQTLKMNYIEAQISKFQNNSDDEEVDTEFAVEKANVMAIKGLRSDAMKVLQKQVNRDFTNPKLHYEIALLYVEMGLPEKTLEALDEAIKYKPNWAHAHYLRGLTLKSLKRREEEIEAYRKAIEFDDQLIEAYHNLGMALKKNGDSKGGDAALSKAINVLE